MASSPPSQSSLCRELQRCFSESILDQIPAASDEKAAVPTTEEHDAVGAPSSGLQRQVSKSILDQIPAANDEEHDADSATSETYADTCVNTDDEAMDTEPDDCDATICDPDSDTPSSWGSRSSSWDSNLWNLIGGRPPAADTPLTESTLDSQDTAADDPNWPPEKTPHDQHWSEIAAFSQAVSDMLPCANCTWFSSEPLGLLDLTDFDMCSSCAEGFILSNVVGQCEYFKIGITENPYQRWVRSDCGYQHSGWSFMYVLYVAPTSKWKLHALDSEKTRALKSTSTGSMERFLVDKFRHLPECINRQPGGDCPSNGSPHFCYVVGRYDPL